jgi:hypothetical protein
VSNEVDRVSGSHRTSASFAELAQCAQLAQFASFSAVTRCRFDASVVGTCGRAIRFIVRAGSGLFNLSFILSFIQAPAHGVSFNFPLVISREPQAPGSGLSFNSPEPLSNHPLTR